MFKNINESNEIIVKAITIIDYKYLDIIYIL